MAEQETEKQLSKRAQRRAKAESEAATVNADSDAASDTAAASADVLAGAPTTDAEEIREENRKARRAAASRRRASRERERREAEAIGLDAGEIVDDALVRGSDSVGKWLVRNRRVIETLIALGLLGWGAMIFKAWYDRKTSGEASAVLSEALQAQFARIGEPDDRNPLPSFPTREERDAKVAEAFLAATQSHPEHGTAAMAMLGRASTLLDDDKFDEAADLFRKVQQHPEVKHDTELRGKALDGLAIALEGKGDVDGALATYRDLEQLQAKGYVELAQYQQARLLFDKGEKDKAKELLTRASEAAGKEDPMAMLTGGAPPSFLQSAIKQLKARVMPGATASLGDTFKQLGLKAMDANAPGAPVPAPSALPAPSADTPPAPKSERGSMPSSAPTEPAPPPGDAPATPTGSAPSNE